MKRIDERRFDFVPKYLWTTMSTNDKDNLRNYHLYWRHYNDNDKKIEQLEKELKDRKERKKSYVKKFINLNKDLDHLRNDTISVLVFPNSKQEIIIMVLSVEGDITLKVLP